MIFNKKYLSLAIIIACLVFQNAYSQKYKDLQVQIDSYFVDRLQSIDEENHLVLFDYKSKVNSSLVENAKTFVWERWKNQVLSKDSLPMASNASGDRKEFNKHEWKLKKEEPMPFYYIRKSEDDKLKHALFLNLHGSGPKQMEIDATVGWSLKYDDKPSIYFIPQIPSEKRYRWWFKPVQYAWERLFRLAMVNDQIDINKMYVMGISEGGYGSQRLAAFYADYLAGAGPMAGGEPLKNAPPLNFRNIAFSLQTGENDKGFGRNTLTLEAKKEFNKLADSNSGQFLHKIELQANKGHWIDYTVTTPWLINFSRNSSPKHVSWVLFPMDGRYRKGFYNVAINKPLNINEGDEFDRAYFDIVYEGNIINIQAELMDNDMLKRKKIEQLDLSIFLDERYIDYSKKVKVFVNNKLVSSKKVKLELSNMVESCGLFGDSERIFPAKINVIL